MMNFLDNLRPCFSKLESKDFLDTNGDLLDFSGVSSSLSPSRNLSNLFWRHLDFSKLFPTGKSRIQVLEVGCGSGRYAKTLSEFHGKINYVGFDITSSESWSEIATNYEAQFFVDEASNVGRFLTNTDVVITQSSLEHILDDLRFFKDLSEHYEQTKRPLVSINLVPSPANLLLSPFHGIRQYSKGSLSQISKTVSPAKLEVFQLGGRATTRFHFREITLNSLLKRAPKVGTDSYREGLIAAIRSDCRAKPRKGGSWWNSTFIAFIIKFGVEGNCEFDYKALV